ncbi:TPA: hypothetical protein DCZ09_03520 [Candidatus Nomurabacteria bacterium]|nr:MAG: hypothetical protein A3A11_00515 [Candidatus Nomurabacteria bacterium RIFCSPLOWO2_01_FULL_43_15]HBA46115.1 hypothetical protein [Candidatus Nomurabacteria bacterium]
MTEGAVSSFSFNEIIAQIPVSVLWLTLVVFTALALILGLALVFHWNRYKLYSPATDTTRTVYFVGLLILLVLCGIFSILYSM